MPTFCIASDRQVSETGGVRTFRYPLSRPGWPAAGGLLALDEHRIGASARTSVQVASESTVVTLVLSGVLQIEPRPGEFRVLGPSTSLVHSALQRGAVQLSNLSDSAVTRVVQVTLAGASRASGSVGGDHATVGHATVRLSDRFIGEGPGVILVCDGVFENEAVDPLNAGDWIELDGTAGDLAIVQGDGLLLVVDIVSPGIDAREPSRHP